MVERKHIKLIAITRVHMFRYTEQLKRRFGIPRSMQRHPWELGYVQDVSRLALSLVNTLTSTTIAQYWLSSKLKG